MLISCLQCTVTVRTMITGMAPPIADHVHIWSLSPGRPVMTLHARVDRAAVHDRALERVLACLRERFGVRHATVQLEHGRCADPPECTADASRSLRRGNRADDAEPALESRESRLSALCV